MNRLRLVRLHRRTRRELVEHRYNETGDWRLRWFLMTGRWPAPKGLMRI